MVIMKFIPVYVLICQQSIIVFIWVFLLIVEMLFEKPKKLIQSPMDAITAAILVTRANCIVFPNKGWQLLSFFMLDFLCYTLACREKMSNQAERMPSISYVPKSAR